ncbi:TonB-dependent receptor [Undibacterium sp. RuTC16W]|uniref:TonB-dependent receptor n=1 Tax=Undibacterium sp. RuTC16W TaxID=3413048 RepID=UPI003BF2F387
MRKLDTKKTLISMLISQIFMTSAFAVEGDANNSAIETVVIEAQRTSNGVARKAQEEAPNLINLLTATEMRKLPDVNIAESVRRIPGISLETDTGEGRFINIRGLDADLNSTTFGGLRLPPSNNATPFSGGRAVALDAIPTGLVGAITVTKTNLPEQDSEALGGTIEITPKTAPLNGKPFFEGRIGTGREQLRRTSITDLSFSAGGRFGGDGATKSIATAYSDNPFSVVITGAYYEDKRGIDDVEPAFVDDGINSALAYAGWDQRWYQYNRKRHGVGMDFGYQADSKNSYYIRAFDAGYTETVLRQRLTITPDGNPLSITGGLSDGLGVNGFDKTLRQEKETINNQVFVIGGKNQFDDKVIDYRLGMTKGSFDKKYDYNSDFNYTPSGTATIVYNNLGSGNTPAFVTGTDYLNPSNYSLVKFQNSTQNISDKEWSTAINVKFPVSWGRFDSESLKLGISTRLRTREVNGQPYSYLGIPALSMTDASYGPSVTFYDGAYKNGPQLSPDVLQRLLSGYQTISTNNKVNAALQYQKDKEDVYATYGQYQMNIDKLGVVTGIRIESTHGTYDANGKGVDINGNVFVTPVRQGKSYTNFFPSLQARYELEKGLIVRGAYSSTIARPGFNQVNASLNVDPSANTVSRGNPDLNPVTANSFDISVEKYLSNSGIVSIGIFDKEISNYIANNLTNQTFPNNGLFAGFVGVAHVYSYTNVGKSRATGIEFNYEQKFKTLPDLWSGLGFGANYTYVNSRFEIRPGEFASMPSTSKQTANANLSYDRNGLNLRLGAYYVSRNLWAIGGSSASDNFSEARTSVDFGSSYAINDYTSIYFNAKNLTNTPLQFSEGASNRTIQREFYGATYQIGLNINY